MERQMKISSIRALELLLWGVCAFHLLVGLSLNVPLVPLDVMASYYGASVEWTPQFVYILKPLGAFMFVLGGLAAAAAIKPLRHKTVVYGFVALFSIRALQRLVFRQEVSNAFAIPEARNLGAMILFFALAAVLFLLYRSAEKRQTLPS
jgi:hypothetical protein